MDSKDLIGLALLEKDKAYVPYSKFKVGFATETTKGVFGGANIENASYSMTMCAERVGMFQAIMAGCRKGDFKKIAIVVESENPDDATFIVPCGACLQVMSEHVEPDTEILLGNKNGEFHTYKFKDLLPITFDILKHNH